MLGAAQSSKVEKPDRTPASIDLSADNDGRSMHRLVSELCPISLTAHRRWPILRQMSVSIRAMRQSCCGSPRISTSLPKPETTQSA
jgi:hypothetical protein